MSHVRIKIQDLRDARARLEDNDLPVTTTRLAKTVGVQVGTLWHILKYSAPWLRKELKVVRGRRGDDGVTQEMYRRAVYRVHKKYGLVALFLVAEDLRVTKVAAKDFLHAHPAALMKHPLVPGWYAKYVITISSLPREHRTVQNIASGLKERYGFGSPQSVRAYLRKHPSVVHEFGIAGFSCGLRRDTSEI